MLIAIAALAAWPSAARAELPWMMPRAQPFFDIPWQAQHQGCPWPWGVWTCEATAPNPRPPGAPGSPGCPCDGDQAVDYGVHPIAHRKCSWYATVDAVPLMYDGDAARNFANQGTTGVSVLNSNDLNTEFSAGGRYKLGTALTDVLQIEGSYIGHFSYRAQADVRDDTANAIGGLGNLSTPFSNFGDPALIPGLDYNNLVTTQFRNRYTTGELNFRYRIDMHPSPFDLFALVGVRYLRMDEFFRYHSEAVVPLPAGGINDVVVNTGNELWGPQLGFSSNVMVMDRYWIETDVKGAICNNSVSQNTLYTNTNAIGGVNAFGTGRAEERTAFVLDMSLVGNYQLTPNLSFRAGYQATWIAGVGLALDNFQADTNVLTLGPGQLDHSGTAVYHGPVVGLTWQR